MLKQPLLLLCSLLALPLGISSIAGSSDVSDQICHATDLSDCYPKIFEPTNEFQVIHDDQDIPAGLHVRMNMQTGLTEAKLDDGNDDEEVNAVLAIEDDAKASPSEEPTPEFKFSENSQRVLKATGQYPSKDFGGARHSTDALDSSYSSTFAANKPILDTISSNNPDRSTLLLALENLEYAAHDIHHGLQLTQSATSMHTLTGLLNSTNTDVQIRTAAALILGTAIQNNPAALTAALSHFYTDAYPTGPLEAVLMALLHEQFPAFQARLVYLLSGLVQDPEQLLKFIRADGLGLLSVVFAGAPASGAEGARLRRKIADFVLDRFLQPDSLAGLRTLHQDSREARQAETGTPEQEDPWVLLEPDGSTREVPADSFPMPKVANMATKLHAWCQVFEEGLKRWKEGSADAAGADAAEHVALTRTSLEEKLKGYGCSCEDRYKCQAKS